MIDQLQERDQVTQQHKAVAHMAEQIAKVHRDLAEVFESGCADALLKQSGRRSAALMEELGDIMNGMDIVDDSDNWMDDVFERAHELFPVAASSSVREEARNAALEECCQLCAKELDTWTGDNSVYVERALSWVMDEISKLQSQPAEQVAAPGQTS